MRCRSSCVGFFMEVRQVDYEAVPGSRKTGARTYRRRRSSADWDRLENAGDPADTPALHSKHPRGKPRGMAETDVCGPGRTRVSRVGLGVPPEPSQPHSARRRVQHAGRVRSPDQRQPSRSKLRGIGPIANEVPTWNVKNLAVIGWDFHLFPIIMTPNDNATAHPAHQYDAEVRKVIPFYDTIQSETLDLVRTVAGEPAQWVDTGAGTGALVERALAAFPRTRFVLADPSEAMLAQARLRLSGAKVERVTLLPAVDSAGLARVKPQLHAQVVTAIM